MLLPYKGIDVIFHIDSRRCSLGILVMTEGPTAEFQSRYTSA